MITLHASDARREFVEVFLNAKRDLVGINRNIKLFAVLIPASEYVQLEKLR
jgi:PHD/YefM family antitoxin component YafN of YafNO toxin-antitoxin module